MEGQSSHNGHRQQQDATVDPRAIQEFIDRQGRSHSDRIHVSLLGISIDPPSDDENNPLTRSVISGAQQSGPSTIGDRGNSERLRHKRPETFAESSELLEPPERTVAGTGAWSENSVSDTTDLLTGATADMAKQLRDAFEDSADDKQFLPLDKLEAIVTLKAVQAELDKCGYIDKTISAQSIFQKQEIEGDGRTQYTSYQKIFAVLALIGKVECISDFFNENIRDWDLPLKELNTAQGTFLVSRLQKDVPGPGYLLQTARKWTRGDIAFFQSQQWIICAPFFARADHLTEKVHLYSLSTRDVLPFVKSGTDDRGNPAFLNQGFFSTVRRVKIHPAHHNFQTHADNAGADFAVKEITWEWDNNDDPSTQKERRKNFEEEVQALKRFCQKNERYIVKLLATYEISGKYHLLFPAADGNLSNLWKSIQSPEEIPASWLVQECWGVAQALQKIHLYRYTPPSEELLLPLEQHRNHGIHGDIKPANILWFQRLPSYLVDNVADARHTSQGAHSSGPGYLQLSDFGTVKFHRYMTMAGNDILVRGNAYRAPESELEGKQGSAAIDIWALGCLYLDLVTWYLRGCDAVSEHFPLARQADEPKQLIEGLEPEDKFFIAKTRLFTGQRFHIVKPRVSEWIMRLRREPRCSQFIHDFLDLIDTYMLVVNPKERHPCGAVVRTLDEFRRKCARNDDYYKIGKPHTWLNPRSNCTLLKAKVRQLGQLIDSHGQIVSLVFILVIAAILLLYWQFEERRYGSGDREPDLRLYRQL